MRNSATGSLISAFLLFIAVCFVGRDPCACLGNVRSPRCSWDTLLAPPFLCFPPEEDLSSHQRSHFNPRAYNVWDMFISLNFPYLHACLAAWCMKGKPREWVNGDGSFWRAPPCVGLWRITLPACEAGITMVTEYNLNKPSLWQPWTTRRSKIIHA